MNNTKIHLISCYAPTEDQTTKNREETEKFYNKLSALINRISKRDTLIVGGDFNARTKLTDTNRDGFLNNVGRYARNTINENGKYLVELCKIHNLKLTNTFFKHKPSQQTTWESALTNKNERKNPYRFQIDYIAIRNNSFTKILDSRAYNCWRTNSDHKPLIATISLYTNQSKPIKSKPNLNISALQNPKNKRNTNLTS